MFKAIDETAIGSSNVVNNKDLGLISLKIKRVRLLDGRPANPIQAAPSPVLGKRKAGDLCIDFGEEETQPFEQSAVTWAVSSYEDDTPGAKPSTYVSFAFRYRSPDFLEAQGIIPEGELTTIALTKKEPATPKIPLVMPAVLPMPPPLALPLPAPKMPPPRRMASLPAPPVRLESEEPPPPATRPAKKPRLSSDALGNPPVRTLRRPSHELRRAASTPVKTVSTSTLPADTTPYQGTFFVTRPSSAYHYLSVPPSSSDTSPDNTANDDSSLFE
ncbi:hypothetical protein NLJ89_g4769 [Agrocybe chaxingu]|uniref:Uncharacterized protein n=1 Tax=Agrocybe chaxingu TaxID=84603 RepID=A0A9W8MVM6_9AGAR|nr:hypothetical protein NLJ89_g4769 [Agrocybe chaxingu]